MILFYDPPQRQTFKYVAKDARSPHLLCKPLYRFTMRGERGGRERLSRLKASLYMSLVFHWLCQESRGLILGDFRWKFQRNNERHTAWGCISGWTYNKLERAAAAHDRQQRKNITASPCCHPQQSHHESHSLSQRHKQICSRAHQKLGSAYKTSNSHI